MSAAKNKKYFTEMLLTFTVSNGWLEEVMLPIVRTPLHTTLCPPLLVAASHVRSSGQVGEVGEH